MRALPFAIYRGKLEILQKIWEWAKTKQTTEKINIICY